MYKIPKVIVSCRIHPHLKEDLEEEAMTSELTMSNYLETIIQNRHQNDSESFEELNDQIQNLESELESLNETAEEVQDEFNDEIKLLKEQIESLRLENQRLAYENQSLENLTTERDQLESHNLKLIQELEELSENLENLESQLPFQLDHFEKDQLKSYLEQLADYHPDAPMNQLLLGSLDTTIRTENAWLNIPLISSYLKQSKITES